MRTPVGRRGVAPRSLGLQPSAITRPAHDPLPRSLSSATSSSGRNRTFESPVNSRLPDHSASLEWTGGRCQPAPRRLASSCQRAVPPCRGQTNPCTRAASRPGGFGGRDRYPGEGRGLSPALPESEVSVLPLDDPESKTDCVGPEGIEPSPHRVRAGCAAATPRVCCRTVGREGFDRNWTESTKWTESSDGHGAKRSAPSSLRLKAGCPAR
jgi:hypothetical protein